MYIVYEIRITLKILLKNNTLIDLHKVFMNGCRRYLHFEPKYKHEHFPTLTAFFSSRHPELTINMLVYNGLIRQ